MELMTERTIFRDPTFPWQINKKTGFTNDVKPVNKAYLFLRTLLK